MTRNEIDRAIAELQSALEVARHANARAYGLTLKLHGIAAEECAQETQALLVHEARRAQECIREITVRRTDSMLLAVFNEAGADAPPFVAARVGRASSTPGPARAHFFGEVLAEPCSYTYSGRRNEFLFGSLGS